MNTKPISRHTRRKLASAMGTPSCAEQLCNTIDSLISRVNELEMEVSSKPEPALGGRMDDVENLINGVSQRVDVLEKDPVPAPEPALDPVVAAAEPALIPSGTTVPFSTKPKKRSNKK